MNSSSLLTETPKAYGRLPLQQMARPRCQAHSGPSHQIVQWRFRRLRGFLPSLKCHSPACPEQYAMHSLFLHSLFFNLSFLPMKSVGKKSIDWIARTLCANRAPRFNCSLTCSVGFFYGVGFNVTYPHLFLPIRRAQVVVAIPANKKEKERYKAGIYFSLFPQWLLYL